VFEIAKKTFQYGSNTVTIETGEIARQAGGAVMVNVDDTVVLATVVGAKNAKPGQDFFPLTVDYVEKFYAAGRIPGGFFKREGRPSERETLISRLIDRPIRPLFPDGFYNEVQVVITLMSSNPEVDSDIPAMIGASAALAISGIPFHGPLGAARVGYIDGQFVLNPAVSKMPSSKLDLVVAGTEAAVLMVESEAHELSEEVMLGAVVFGHDQMQTVINAIHELVEAGGKAEWEWQAAPRNEALIEKINQLADADMRAAYRVRDKQARTAQVSAVEKAVARALADEAASQGLSAPDSTEVGNLLFELQSRIVRSQILSGEPRIDGRDTRTVRPIAIRTGVLPRAHGSALFTRGETQALVVATLGTNRDEQVIDAINGEYRERFMLHYNMPPYATGETGRVGSPKRREIGHGRLAKRALVPLLPEVASFGYSIRVVSEITESNGSSSMASVCGGCLAMMDAGVPIKAHVAGIAMGLIKEGSRFAVLSDILGDEDHLGDMDFKVAGTENGICACQMDLKVDGLPYDILLQALEQARAGRLHILNEMNKTISAPAEDYKPHAPRIVKMRVAKDYIGAIIGPGGKIIQEIQRVTGTTITIEEINNEGHVEIASPDKACIDAALARIRAIVAEPEVGEVYEGKVKTITTFGAFVEFMPGKDGLLHISEISNDRLASMDGVFKEGETVQVKLIEIDKKTGKYRLSRKVLLGNSSPRPERKKPNSEISSPENA